MLLKNKSLNNLNGSAISYWEDIVMPKYWAMSKKSQFDPANKLWIRVYRNIFPVFRPHPWKRVVRTSYLKQYNRLFVTSKSTVTSLELNSPIQPKAKWLDQNKSRPHSNETTNSKDVMELRHQENTRNHQILNPPEVTGVTKILPTCHAERLWT